MSVYKEIGALVNKINKKSVQIYSDSADWGVPIKDYSDPLIKEVNTVCKDIYGLKPVNVKYETGFTQTFEFNGGWPAVIEAGFETANIIFVSTDKKSGIKGYLYVQTHTSITAAKKAREYDA